MNPTKIVLENSTTVLCSSYQWTWQRNPFTLVAFRFEELVLIFACSLLTWNKWFGFLFPSKITSLTTNVGRQTYIQTNRDKHEKDWYRLMIEQINQRMRQTSKRKTDRQADRQTGLVQRQTYLKIGNLGSAKNLSISFVTVKSGFFFNDMKWLFNTLQLKAPIVGLRITHTQTGENPKAGSFKILFGHFPQKYIW